MLAAIAVQGALKTNAVVALVFPLVILAVPILDSSFVIAKRIKYGQPVYQADSWHFHHRFANIGFSQRRTVLYLYAWTIVLAMLALALRFVPYSDDHGHFNVGWSLVIAAFGLAAVAASVYLVLVLEILKLKRFRQFQLRREHAAAGRAAARRGARSTRGVAHELETGEFDDRPSSAASRERRAPCRAPSSSSGTTRVTCCSTWIRRPGRPAHVRADRRAARSRRARSCRRATVSRSSSTPTPYEVLDPDSGPSESFRAEVRRRARPGLARPAAARPLRTRARTRPGPSRCPGSRRRGARRCPPHARGRRRTAARHSCAPAPAPGRGERWMPPPHSCSPPSQSVARGCDAGRVAEAPCRS